MSRGSTPSSDRPECRWIQRELEQQSLAYAIARVVPEHLAEVTAHKGEHIAKTEAAVKYRLTKEITTPTASITTSPSC